MKPEAKKQAVAIVLLILFAVTILYAAFGVSTPNASKTIYYVKDQRSPANGIPDVSAEIDATFTAKGSLSAGNDITVNILLKPITTDFAKYYDAVGYDVQGGSSGIVHTIRPSGSFFVENYSIKVDTETDLYFWYIPINTSISVNAGPSVDSNPAIHISGISDTIAWQNGEQATRLGWIVIAFSWLLLQPLFEALAKLK